MGMTLAEYAKLYPQEEPESERKAIEGVAQTYWEQLQEREQVKRLKESISQQLQEGNAPQYILYAALRAIGIATHDNEWAEAGATILDGIYGDLTQQSLLEDEAAISMKRLKDMQEKYRERSKQRLKTQINGYKRLYKALNEAWQAVESLDGSEFSLDDWEDWDEP